MDAFCALCIGIARSFLEAWTLMLAWLWFIVPLGLAPLSYGKAYGLDIAFGVVALSSFRSGFVSKEETKSLTNTSITKVFATLMGLGIAYVAHLIGAGT